MRFTPKKIALYVSFLFLFSCHHQEMKLPADVQSIEVTSFTNKYSFFLKEGKYSISTTKLDTFISLLKEMEQIKEAKYQVIGIIEFSNKTKKTIMRSGNRIVIQDNEKYFSSELDFNLYIKQK